MQIATISQISKYDGQEVEIRGWLYNSRKSSKVCFLLVRDGSGIIQCVIGKNDFDEKDWETARSLGQESSLIIQGKVRADKRSPGGYELLVTDLNVIQNTQDYPITPKEHGDAFLQDRRHLWIRSRKQHAILKIRATVIKATRDYLDENGFLLMDTPIFTPNACEGTTTLFETQYFEHKAYLSQSGQLYNEATVMAFGKVYCFGPTFRAEKTKTRRHLIEFWMVEPEIAYAELDDIMDLAEGHVYRIVKEVLVKNQPELEILERDVSKLEAIEMPFPRVHYENAVETIKESNPDFIDGDDFGAPDEDVLSKSYDRPILVHRYPKDVKAFYMKGDPQNDRYALCVDMIAPEGYGEIVGGGQREDDYDTLIEKIKQHNLDLNDFDWYLDLRKYGSVPHGGYGLGIERVVAWMCGIRHIRETIPFPRMLYRMRP